MENFSLEDLKSFGEYILSKERTERMVNHPNAANMPPVNDRLSMIHEEDIIRWKQLKESNKNGTIEN